MNERMTVFDIGLMTHRPILTGVAGGEAAARALAPHIDSWVAAMPLVLDFQSVEVLGGSALRHLLSTIHLHPRCAQSAVILANLSEDNLEEADLVAEAMRSPYIRANCSNSRVHDPEVRGPLDPKVARTLQLVIEAGEADAQTVSRLSQEAGVVTAWNNRLVALQEMGILRERKVGKRKFYSPVLEELSYGC